MFLTMVVSSEIVEVRFSGNSAERERERKRERETRFVVRRQEQKIHKPYCTYAMHTNNHWTYSLTSYVIEFQILNSSFHFFRKRPSADMQKCNKKKKSHCIPPKLFKLYKKKYSLLFSSEN